MTVEPFETFSGQTVTGLKFQFIQNHTYKAHLRENVFYIRDEIEREYRLM